jgi:hypothetical protein
VAKNAQMAQKHRNERKGMLVMLMKNRGENMHTARNSEAGRAPRLTWRETATRWNRVVAFWPSAADVLLCSSTYTREVSESENHKRRSEGKWKQQHTHTHAHTHTDTHTHIHTHTHTHTHTDIPARRA